MTKHLLNEAGEGSSINEWLIVKKLSPLRFNSSFQRSLEFGIDNRLTKGFFISCDPNLRMCEVVSLVINVFIIILSKTCLDSFLCQKYEKSV